MTLTLSPTAWRGHRYRLADAAGRELGTVDLARWRSAGTLVLGGVAYGLRKDPSDGALVLAGLDGIPVAQASTPRALSRRYRIDWGEGQGELTRTSLWPWAPFALDRDDGVRQMNLVPRGFPRKRLEVEAIDAWPLARTAFVATLALLALRHQRRRHRV